MSGEFSIGEDAGGTGAAFEFLVDAFQRFLAAHPFLVGGGQSECHPTVPPKTAREDFQNPCGFALEVFGMFSV
jgi:hypothetical protein